MIFAPLFSPTVFCSLRAALTTADGTGTPMLIQQTTFQIHAKSEESGITCDGEDGGTD